MIWLFKINETFWGNIPKVNEHYLFAVDNIDFDVTLYDVSLYLTTAKYFLLNDANPDDIYILQYSGINANPSRLLIDKNTDYYNVVRNYYMNNKDK